MERQASHEEDAVTVQIDQIYTHLMQRADRIHDPLVRGVAELGIIAPTIGCLIARETVQDIRNARNN